MLPGRINPGGWGTLVEILTRLPMNLSDRFEAVARCDIVHAFPDRRLFLSRVRALIAFNPRIRVKA
jgi:hypothetical protein